MKMQKKTANILTAQQFGRVDVDVDCGVGDMSSGVNISSICNQSTNLTQPCIPPGSPNRLPALASGEGGNYVRQRCAIPNRTWVAVAVRQVCQLLLYTPVCCTSRVSSSESVWSSSTTTCVTDSLDTIFVVEQRSRSSGWRSSTSTANTLRNCYARPVVWYRVILGQ